MAVVVTQELRPLELLPFSRKKGLAGWVVLSLTHQPPSLLLPTTATRPKPSSALAEVSAVFHAKLAYPDFALRLSSGILTSILDLPILSGGVPCLVSALVSS